MKKILGLLKKVLPWLVALLIFVYLFHEYKPAQLWQAIKHVNPVFFLTVTVTYFIILYVVDCKTISWVLTRFGYPISTREIYPARGVTYLIMNLNYPASQAAFAYYLKRTHKIPIFEVLGIFFFVALIDLYILIAVGFVGSFFQEAVIRGVDIGSYTRIVALVAYLGMIVNLIFWRKLKIFKWIREKKLFHVFKEAMVKDYLKTAVFRLPIHISIVVFIYLAIRAFNAVIPFTTVLADIPIAFLVGTIPITPGGLGTTNMAMVELMSPQVSSPVIASGLVSAKELMFALTILWMAVNFTLKSLVGFVWLSKVSRQLFKPTEGDDREEVVSEATHLMGDI